MKKKLKVFRTEAADAKAAWLKAVKDKASQSDISSKLADYQMKLAIVEAAEAEGKKDDDEIGQDAAAQNANEVKLDDLKAMFKDVVDEAVAGVKKLIPENLHAQVTPESLKVILEEALSKQKDVKLDAAGIKAIMQGVITEQVAQVRKASKAFHDDPEAGKIIEIPFGLSKGNLPLHMKQLLNICMRKPMNEGIEQKDLDTGRKEDEKFYGSLLVQGAKALTTTGSGTGAEWVPRNLSSELERRLYLASQVAQAYLAEEVQMPTNPYDWPLLTTRPVFKKNTVENRQGEASDLGTAAFTLTAVKLMALCQFSYEEDEDSIIPILPTLQTQLAEAAAYSLETAIINGDTATTHQDSDITDVNDAAKSWNGLRKLALAVNSLKVDMSTGGISRANLTSILKALGKWGVNTRNLLWIVGPKAWASLMGLDEFALAYARGGASSFAAGAPITWPYGGQGAVSEAARENLNASGVYDGATVTKGSVILVYRPGFKFGSRREFTVEVDRRIRSQTVDVVASFRKAFQPVETPAANTAQTVAIGYNYTS